MSRIWWCFVTTFNKGLPEGSCLGSRLQLMKQPHGMWIQRSDSTNNGVTAGASRVRKKLRVSRDELRAFSAWRTSTKVCEWRRWVVVVVGGLIHWGVSDLLCMRKWGDGGHIQMQWNYKNPSSKMCFFLTMDFKIIIIWILSAVCVLYSCSDYVGGAKIKRMKCVSSHAIC